MALPYVLQQLIDLANGKADVGHSHGELTPLPSNVTYESWDNFPNGISVQSANYTAFTAKGDQLPFAATEGDFNVLTIRGPVQSMQLIFTSSAMFYRCDDACGAAPAWAEWIQHYPPVTDTDFVAQFEAACK